MINRDLPRDLGRPRNDERTALVAGSIIGGCLLVVCLLGLAYAVMGGI